jgi:hypothetical protein
MFKTDVLVPDFHVLIFFLWSFDIVSNLTAPYLNLGLGVRLHLLRICTQRARLFND